MLSGEKTIIQWGIYEAEKATRYYGETIYLVVFSTQNQMFKLLFAAV